MSLNVNNQLKPQLVGSRDTLSRVLLLKKNALKIKTSSGFMEEDRLFCWSTHAVVSGLP